MPLFHSLSHGLFVFQPVLQGRSRPTRKLKAAPTVPPTAALLQKHLLSAPAGLAIIEQILTPQKWHAPVSIETFGMRSHARRSSRVRKIFPFISCTAKVLTVVLKWTALDAKQAWDPALHSEVQDDVLSPNETNFVSHQQNSCSSDG